MKSLLFTLTIILFTISLSAQKLDYKHGKFIYNSKIYTISELPNIINFNTGQQISYKSIEDINFSRNIWMFVTISSGVISGVGITSLVFFDNVDQPIIGVIGQVFSAVLVIVGIPATVVGGIGWIITSRKRKKRAHNFLDQYNTQTSNSQVIQLKAQSTNNGLGLVLSF